MTPDYQILADDADVTASIRGQLASLTITDKEGMDSDEFELVVTDPLGKIVLPKRGVIIRPSIGWKGRGLVAKGAFEVDEVGHAGPPDVVRIKGRAAQFRGKIKEQREQSYTDQTLGQILKSVAGRNGLTPAIDASLAGIRIPHLDQTNESDANLLTRLGQDFDAVATVKDGHLVFLPTGSGRGASGAPLPTYRLTRSKGVTHDFTISDREGEDTGVKAKWRDLDGAETKEALAGDAGGTVKTLRAVYPTEEQAAAAATAAVAKAKRDQRKLSLDLAVGDPEIVACQPLKVSGFIPEIDEVDWTIEDVTHTLDEGGLVTKLTAKG